MYTFSPLEYLDSMLVDYSLIPHDESYTAEMTAKSAHIKGQDLSKVIVVGNSDMMCMAVIPANCYLLQGQLASLLKIPNLTIVPEYLFSNKFPECELGAMPPLGNLYNMAVYVAAELTHNKNITFNGGNHKLLINMLTADFLSIANAKIIKKGYKVMHSKAPHQQAQTSSFRWR